MHVLVVFGNGGQCFQNQPSAVASNGNFSICDAYFPLGQFQKGQVSTSNSGLATPSKHNATSTFKSCENTGGGLLFVFFY